MLACALLFLVIVSFILHLLRNFKLTSLDGFQFRHEILKFCALGIVNLICLCLAVENSRLDDIFLKPVKLLLSMHFAVSNI